jgi:hypothetical protein
MLNQSEYVVTASSVEFATIYTEGPFYTFPEEAVVSGSTSVKIKEALADQKVHTGELDTMNLFLGNSSITETEVAAQAWDANDPNATFSIHLSGL